MPKPKVTVGKEYGYLVINGNYYEVDNLRGEVKFKKANKAEIKDKLKKAEKIAEALKTKVDVKAILEESVMRISLKEANKLYKLLFESKRKYKPKTRKHHCVDVAVGNFILPIVE